MAFLFVHLFTKYQKHFWMDYEKRLHDEDVVNIYNEGEYCDNYLDVSFRRK